MSIARRSADALTALVSQTEAAATLLIPSPKSRQIPEVMFCIITFAGTLSFDFYPICIPYVNKAEIINKQAKNRNETDSNLSLGIRLTRVKRLSRKRCCDTRPDRCQEGSRLDSQSNNPSTGWFDVSAE